MAEWNSLLANNPGVIGSGVQTSMYAGAEQAQKAHEALYAQQLKQTTEALVARSIDDRGNFDQDRFMSLAAKTPFGATAMTKGLEMVGAQWNTAQAAAKAGTAMNAMGVDPSKIFPESSWRSQPVNAPMGVTSDTDPRAARAGAGWARGPVKAPVKQSSSLAPATIDNTGFTTPDMQSDSGYTAKTTTVTGQGQSATAGDISASNLSALEGPGPSAADVDRAYEETAPKHSALYNIGHMNAGQNLTGAAHGGLQMPAIPDLKSMDPKASAAVANSLRNSGLYKGNDVPGPQMQAAYDAKVKTDWDALSAREPKASQYIDKDGQVDIGAFQKEHAKWVSEAKAFQNTIAGKTNEAYNEKMQQKTTQLEQTRASQSIESTAATLNRLADVRKMYPLADEKSLPVIDDALQTIGQIDDYIKTLNAMKSEVAKHPMDPKQFATEVFSQKGLLLSLDKAGTEGQRADIEHLLAVNPGFKSIVLANKDRPLKDVLQAVALTAGTASSQSEVIDILKKTFENSRDSGPAAQVLKRFSKPTKSWSKKPMKVKEGTRRKNNLGAWVTFTNGQWKLE